ncbi:flagella basal body P-ring formation protein FlgA [Ramlibacter sp.]|uniref:flagella basal body P-ring formation protein FlgA n=1 Tax=Ramlibacter sp. TaxID=1917967 RepID=UPI003D0E0062
MRRSMWTVRRCLGPGSAAALATGMLLAAAMPASAQASGLRGNAGARANPTVEVRLHDSIRTNRVDVTLGDVASLTTQDPALLKRLLALPLRPATSGAMRYAREELARLMSAGAGVDAGAIAWQGPRQVRVARGAGEIPADEVSRVARNALQEALMHGGFDAQLTLAREAPDLALPAGRGALKVRPLAQPPAPGRVAVWVDAWVDGAHVRSVPLHFDVQGMRAVAPATPRGGDMAASKPVAVAIPGSALAAASAPDVASSSLLAPAPEVARGDGVAVQLRASGMELELRGEALQAGRAGEWIGVKTGAALAPVQARVIARGRVEVSQ